LKSSNGLSSYEIADYLKNVIDNLKYVDNSDINHIQKNLDQYLDSMIKGGGIEKGIPTLYTKLDEMLSITNGSFIVIGARPGIGKSAFALNLIHHFSQQKQKTLFISLEMTEKEIVNRLVSLTTGIHATRITRRVDLNRIEIQDIERARKSLKKHFINIFDKGSLKVENLIHLCTKLKQKKQLDILVVDYIGLLDSTQYQGQRTNQIGYISRKLKQIAMDLKIPVIALSQLNRNVVDKANGKMREPTLSDLRDSGSIEQDANAVIFIHSLSKDTDNFDDRYLKLLIAKNRNGSVGKVLMNFQPNVLRFREGEFDDSGKIHEHQLSSITT
jgi:replicative DNA helicase